MIFPLLANRVWRTYLGGLVLDSLEGKAAPADTHFPEDWIGSSTLARNPGREDCPDEGISRVVLPDGSHVPITDVLSRPAGVLVKFLDSSIRLHVQAHPSVSFARRRLGSDHGKTELWMGIAAREDSAACGYLGFRRRVSKEDWGALIAAQRIDEMLDHMHRVPLGPGDNYLIEAGVPHCIGAGVLLVEVQEPSDWAVRCEFERGGYVLPESARWMGIGMTECLDVFDYEPLSLEQALERWRLLPRDEVGAAGYSLQWICSPENTDRFLVRRMVVTERARVPVNPLEIHILVSGSGSADGVPLKRFDRYIVGEGHAEILFEPSQEPMEIYRCWAP